jgi:hypothetical protein
MRAVSVRCADLLLSFAAYAEAVDVRAIDECPELIAELRNHIGLVRRIQIRLDVDVDERVRIAENRRLDLWQNVASEVAPTALIAEAIVVVMVCGSIVWCARDARYPRAARKIGRV